jgi:crotonobetainyl-CoA:carnitine CoA-transferase CaiB-like acyl-CoA transferase
MPALPGSPPIVDGPRAAAPALNQHAAAILGEVGYGPDAVARLRTAGVVGKA